MTRPPPLDKPKGGRQPSQTGFGNDSELSSRQASDFAFGPPADMKPPSPLSAWVRGDTTLFEDKEKIVTPPTALPQSHTSPIDGYGRGDVFSGALANLSPTTGGAGIFPSAAKPPAAAVEKHHHHSAWESMNTFQPGQHHQFPQRSVAPPGGGGGTFSVRGDGGSGQHHHHASQHHHHAADAEWTAKAVALATLSTDDGGVHGHRGGHPGAAGGGGFQPAVGQPQRGGAASAATASTGSRTPGNAWGTPRPTNIFQQAQLVHQQQQQQQMSHQPQQHQQPNPAASHAQRQGELLMKHSRFFPPPAPITSPLPYRRERAELWYFHATQWDLTRTLPPPPRNPLPEADEERNRGLQKYAKTPYYGDYWMQACFRWFDHVQGKFRYPVPEVQPFVAADVAVELARAPASMIARFAAQ